MRQEKKEEGDTQVLRTAKLQQYKDSRITQERAKKSLLLQWQHYGQTQK